MPVLIADVVSAVVAALVALDVGRTKTVVSSHAPYRSLDDVKTLALTVVPSGIESELVARGRAAQFDFLVDVGVSQHLGGADDAAAMSGVSAIVEQVHRSLLGSVLAGCTCVSAAIEPLMLDDHWQRTKVYTGVVKCRLRITQ